MLLLSTPTAPGSLPSESHACGHPEDLCYRVTTTPNSTSHDAPQREMKPHRGKSAGTTLPLSTTAPLAQPRRSGVPWGHTAWHQQAVWAWSLLYSGLTSCHSVHCHPTPPALSSHLQRDRCALSPPRDSRCFLSASPEYRSYRVWYDVGFRLKRIWGKFPHRQKP